jgi:hypothetical protein
MTTSSSMSVKPRAGQGCLIASNPRRKDHDTQGNDRLILDVGLDRDLRIVLMGGALRVDSKLQRVCAAGLVIELGTHNQDLRTDIDDSKRVIAE